MLYYRTPKQYFTVFNLKKIFVLPYNTLFMSTRASILLFLESRDVSKFPNRYFREGLMFWDLMHKTWFDRFPKKKKKIFSLSLSGDWSFLMSIADDPWYSS